MGPFRVLNEKYKIGWRVEIAWTIRQVFTVDYRFENRETVGQLRGDMGVFR
jgi:hypothetical protein